MTAGVWFIQAAWRAVFRAVDDAGDLPDQHRRAISEGNGHIGVTIGDGDLVVGVDLIVLARTVEISLGGVDAGLRQGGAHVLQVDAVGGKLRRD